MGTQERAVSPPRGQLAMLLRRYVDLLKGDRRHLALLALQAPVVGALLWAVLPANALMPESDGEFSSKAGVVILFIVLSTTWLGVSNAVREVVRERAIVAWEAASGLSPRAYITSKFLALGSLVTAQALLIGFLATARQHAPHRFELIAVAVIAGVAATALGLALSSLAASSDRATALLPVTLVVQLVLAGEWAANANVPLLHEARWLVGTRWAMEAMVGVLNGFTGQVAHGAIALSVLTAIGVVAATRFVARSVRPAVAPGATGPTRPPRSLARPMTVGASAIAVALSVGAGGTGVFAVLHTSAEGVAPLAAPKRPTPTTAVASVPTTAPPVTAPPVTAPPVTAPAVKRTVTTTPPTTVPEVVASTPDIVTPPPAPSTPDLLPTTPEVTPTNATPKPTSPTTNLFRLFNPFAPRVNR